MVKEVDWFLFVNLIQEIKMFIVKVFSSTSSDSTQFHSIDINSFVLRFNIKKGRYTMGRRQDEVIT